MSEKGLEPETAGSLQVDLHEKLEEIMAFEKKIMADK
jgi:hypothetical protein